MLAALRFGATVLPIPMRAISAVPGATQGFGGLRPPLPREGWTNLVADDNIKPEKLV